MLLEVVAAGASLVIVPDAADPATSPADEWVTHLLADRTTLDAMDMTLLRQSCSMRGRRSRR